MQQPPDALPPLTDSERLDLIRRVSESLYGVQGSSYIRPQVGAIHLWASKYETWGPPMTTSERLDSIRRITEDILMAWEKSHTYHLVWLIHYLASEYKMTPAARAEIGKLMEATHATAS